MAKLKFIEKSRLEEFFGMKSGYVLSFSDRSFHEFVAGATGINIYDDKYNYHSGSKANRLRAFINLESNSTVAKLLEQLLEVRMSIYKNGEAIIDEEFELYSNCKEIIEKLKKESLIEHMEVLQPNNNSLDFELIAKSIRESIEKNEPQSALDRLHTFLFKFIRELCKTHEIHFEKAESLNSIFGKYVKYLLGNDAIESPMSEKILKYSINIMDAFNDIRNNRSLAHDNPVLNYDESVLIFNNVTNTIKFIQHIESKINTNTSNITNEQWDNLPF